MPDAKNVTLTTSSEGHRIKLPVNVHNVGQTIRRSYGSAASLLWTVRKIPTITFTDLYLVVERSNHSPTISAKEVKIRHEEYIDKLSKHLADNLNRMLFDIAVSGNWDRLHD